MNPSARLRSVSIQQFTGPQVRRLGPMWLGPLLRAWEPGRNESICQAAFLVQGTGAGSRLLLTAGRVPAPAAAERRSISPLAAIRATLGSERLSNFSPRGFSIFESATEDISGLRSPLRFKFLASSSSTSWRKRSAFNGLTWLGQASLDTFPHIKVNHATQHSLITGVDSIGVSVPGSHKCSRGLGASQGLF